MRKPSCTSARSAVVRGQFTFPTYERSAGKPSLLTVRGTIPRGVNPGGPRTGREISHEAGGRDHQAAPGRGGDRRPRQHRGVGHDPHRGPRPRSPAGPLRGVPRRRVQGRLPAQGAHRGARHRQRRPSRWRTRSSTTPAPARSATASSGSSRSTSRCGSAPARSVTKRSDAVAARLAAGSSPTPRWVASPSGRRPRTWSTNGCVDLLGDEPGVALLAVGAYGRRELCPASDLDLVLVHDGKRGRDLAALADRLWYPIWDSGFTLDHSVRTPNEARVDRRRRPQGRARSARRAGRRRRPRARRHARSSASATEWRDRARTRLPALDALVAGAPPRRRATSRYALEPDLKEGRGRQPRRRRRCASLGDGDRRVVARRPVRADAIATLFDARVALQRVGRAAPTGCCSSTRTTWPRDLGLGRRRRAHGAREQRGAHHRAGSRTTRGARCGRGWQGPRGRSAAGRDVPLSPGLVLRDGEVALLADASPADDPALVLRAAADAAYLGVPIARPTLRRFDAEPAVGARPVDRRHARRVRRAARRRRRHGAAGRAARRARPPRAVTCPSGTRCAAARSATRSTASPSTVTCSRRWRAPTSSSGRCAGPTCCSSARCCTTSARAVPATTPTTGSCSPQTVATRMGFDARRRRGARRPRAPPPAAAELRHRARPRAIPATIAAVADAVGTEDTLDLLARADRGRLARHRPDRVERRGRRGWSTRLVERDARRAAPTRRRRGRRRGRRRARDPHLDAFDGTLIVEPAPGRGHPRRARRARAARASRSPCSACTRRTCAGRAPTPSTASAIGEFEVEPERGREPDWDAVRRRPARRARRPDRRSASNSRRAARATAPFSRPTAARPAEPRVFVDNDATDAATHRRGAGRRRHRRARPDHRRVRPARQVRVEQAYVSTLGHEVVDTFYVTARRREPS